MSSPSASSEEYIPSPSSQISTPAQVPATEVVGPSSSGPPATRTVYSCQSKRSTGSPRLKRVAMISSFRHSPDVKHREEMHRQFNICPCTSFGMDREQRFPHFFFCNECAIWDSEASTQNLSRKSTISCKYRCKAKHKVDSLYPTQPQKLHYTLRGIYSTDDDVDDDNVADGVEENSDVEEDKEDDENFEYDFVLPEQVYNPSKVTPIADTGEKDFLESNETQDHFRRRKQQHNNISTNDPSHRETWLQTSLQHDSGGLSSTTLRMDDLPFTNPDHVIQQLRHSNTILLSRLCEVETKNGKLTKTISRIKKEKEVMRSNIASYRDGSTEETVSHAKHSKKVTGEECISSAHQFVSTIQSYSAEGRSPSIVKQTCSQIADALWDEDLLGGEMVAAHGSKARHWFSTNNFAPHRILQAMDMRGGVLNYKGVEILRLCETKGKNLCETRQYPALLPFNVLP